LSDPLRCAVLAPAAAPYREPLFASLAAQAGLRLRVLYQAQRLAGWDVDAGWFATEHAYDADVLPALQWRRTGRGPLVVPHRLRLALNRFAPDVVVAWEFGPTALLARAWCSRHHTSLVHFSELGAAAATAVPRPQRRIHELLARRAAAAIGASTQASDRLMALGVDPARTVMSLQSVDGEPIRAAVSASAPPDPRGPNPLRVLCVARLVADKNVGALIDAAARAAPGEVELDVIGNGPLRGELEAQASTSTAVVRFHGALSPSDTALAYAKADALALVSRYEPFGVALREGVAAGLPLIASARAGAVGDIALAGRNAIVVDPDDRAAICMAVLELASNPARRAAMAEASREIDRQWPLQRSVEAFAEAIRLGAASNYGARRPAASSEPG
jgi:glycosyltransferase involved in cell wall biosynthesis